jgi:hypothetical protein
VSPGREHGVPVTEPSPRLRRALPPGIFYTGGRGKTVPGERFGALETVRPAMCGYWYVRCEHGHETSREVKVLRRAMVRFEQGLSKVLPTCAVCEAKP